MEFKRLHQAVADRLLAGDGAAPRDWRRAAFERDTTAQPPGALTDKVAAASCTISDEDMATAKRSAGEDCIFELVVCAAVGESTRQYGCALKALDEACGDERGKRNAT